MTCKDCKRYCECKSIYKDYTFYEYNGSWLIWCDDFVNRHKLHTITYKGLTASQNKYYCIWVTNTDDDESWYFPHNKRLSKRGLKKIIKWILAMKEAEK